MKFVPHPQQTRSLGAPAGWDHSKVHCGSLSIKDDTQGGYPVMKSRWVPEGAEAMCLALGLAQIELGVWAMSHPPVSMVAFPISEAYADRPALAAKLDQALRDMLAIANSNGLVLVNDEKAGMYFAPKSD